MRFLTLVATGWVPGAKHRVFKRGKKEGDDGAGTAGVGWGPHGYGFESELFILLSV